eukprot:3122632-Alexandrium_andersonii.AAC.1
MGLRAELDALSDRELQGTSSLLGRAIRASLLWHTPCPGTPLRRASRVQPFREPSESTGPAAVGALGAPARAKRG